MYSPGGQGVLFCGHLSCPGLALLLLDGGGRAGTRHSSANQYDSMQSTIDASSAGQTTPGTIRAASTSMATESAIFTNPHHSMLTALDRPATATTADSSRRAPSARPARRRPPRRTAPTARRCAPPTSPATAIATRAEHRLRGDHAPRRQHRMARRKASASARVIGLKAAVRRRVGSSKALARSRDRRHGSPRRGRGAARRLSAQPKIIRRNPRATKPAVGCASRRAPVGPDAVRVRHAIIVADRRCRMLAARLVRSLGAAVAALAAIAVSAADPPAGTRRIIATGASRTTTSSSSRKGIGALLKWRIEASRAGLPKPPQHADAARRAPTSPSCAATPPPARRWCRR